MTKKILATVTAILCLGSLGIAWYTHQRHERIQDNEFRTDMDILSLVITEKLYSETYQKGYTCDSGALTKACQLPPGIEAGETPCEPSLAQGKDHHGYRYILDGCRTVNGKITSYRIVAVPILPGETGTH